MNNNHLTADNKYELRCLHFEKSSDLLFRHPGSLELLRISAFSAKQRLQVLSPGLQALTLRTTDHLMLKLAPISFRCQMYVERRVWSLYLSWAKDVLCEETLCFIELLVSPMQNLDSLTGPAAVTSARQTMELVRHLSKGQLFLSLQLQRGAGGSSLLLYSLRIFLLCRDKMDERLGVVQQDSLRLCWLNSLFRKSWLLGKALEIMLLNSLVTLPWTAELNGGLNQRQLRFLFFLLLVLGASGCQDSLSCYKLNTKNKLNSIELTEHDERSSYQFSML